MIVGVGQHIVVRAESSVDNQFQNAHYNNFNLAKYGLRVHTKESTPIENAKLKSYYEESEVESIDADAEKNDFFPNYYFISFSPELAVTNEKIKPNYRNKNTFLFPLEIYILNQVFRI